MSDSRNSNLFDNDDAVSSADDEGFEIVLGERIDMDRRRRVTKKLKKISVTSGDLRKTTTHGSAPVSQRMPQNAGPQWK